MDAAALVVGEGSRLSKKVSYSSYESFGRTNVEQECFENTRSAFLSLFSLSLLVRSLFIFLSPVIEKHIDFVLTVKEKEEEIRRRRNMTRTRTCVASSTWIPGHE